jgi:hypothetical protein
MTDAGEAAWLVSHRQLRRLRQAAGAGALFPFYWGLSQHDVNRLKDQPLMKEGLVGCLWQWQSRTQNRWPAKHS